MMLKFLKNLLLLKWPSTLNKSNSLKKVRLGGSSMHAADHLTWWDKTRRNPLRGGETKPYRRLQNFTKHFVALRFQGSGKAGSWSWWPSGGTFGAFWGFSLIGPWQAGGQGCPRSPQSWFCISKGWGIPTIAIFMSIILDNSGAIVLCFSYRQIVMMFLHTKISAITHSWQQQCFICAKSQAADLANVNQKQQTMIFHTVARVKKRLGLIVGTCCILNSWALTPKARIDHFSLQANTFGTLHNLGLMCALPFRLLSKALLENTFIAQPTLTRLQNQHSHVLWK